MSTATSASRLSHVKARLLAGRTLNEAIDDMWLEYCAGTDRRINALTEEALRESMSTLWDRHGGRPDGSPQVLRWLLNGAASYVRSRGKRLAMGCPNLAAQEDCRREGGHDVLWDAYGSGVCCYCGARFDAGDAAP